MKTNTKKILLWLYPIKTQNEENQPARLIGIAQLKIILPDIKKTSLRSLLNLLIKNNYLRMLNLPNQKQLTITDTGMKAIEAQIPALKGFHTPITQWWVINFLKPPKTDQAFRYLRRFLLNKKAIALTRGVYLFVQKLDPEVKHLLGNLYQGSVIVFKTDTFLYTDMLQLIGQKINLSDTLSLLSGISKEIDQLLAKIDKQKGLTSHQKKQINSLFCRLFELAESSFSLVSNFYPQAKDALDYLKKLQKIAIL